MSEFSDTCKFYLQESGSNVYQIARTANLDRTTVQRMLTGKRLPSPEFVKKFCEHLRINTIDKSKILESYMIEKIGKTTYQNRKYIGVLIQHLSKSLDTQETQLSSSMVRCPSDSLMTEVLNTAFSDTSKEQHILTNIPASHEYFFHRLQQLQKEYGKCLPVRHLMSMHPNPLNIPRSNVNLEKLYYILPFLFSSYGSYEPSYYYSRMLDSDRQTQLFPYYLITANQLLLFSHDLKTGIIHTDSDTVMEYTRLFKSIAENAQPLVVRYSNPVAALNYYEDITIKYGMPTRALEAQPCINAYFSSPNQFHKLCPDSVPGKDFLIQAAISGYNRYYEESEGTLSLCTMRGLKSFLQNGRLSGGLTIYSEPMAMSDRKFMVRHFLKLLESTDFYAVANDNFEIADPLQIEVYDKHLLHIISSKPSFFNFLTFSESSICEAFLDYIDALAESDTIISPQLVRAELETMLEEM